MKWMSILALIVVPMFVKAADGQRYYVKDPGHGRLLKENFDTSYWKTFWTEDTWHLCCVFVDFDGDDMDEMMAITTSDEDPMGDYWKIWKQCKGGGGMAQVQFCGNLFYWCHASSFYKMHCRNGVNEVLGIGMKAGYMDKDCRNIVKSTPDCRFILSERGQYYLQEITPDVDAMFKGLSVEYIERLYPEWYFGFDFKPPKDIPHNPYRERPPYVNPKGDFRVGGGIQEPPKFAEFAERYRQTKIQKFGADNNSDAVYAVFLDADNDGDTDFYVTTDLDKLDGDDYSWELYVQHSGEFVKAMDVVYPVTSRKELCGLPPTVKSSQTSFCRVVRLDVEPFFLIVDKEKKNQVRDAITNSFAHRVEKLACRAYFRDCSSSADSK